MTISEEIIKVLDALCARFGIAVDWTAENVLPYLSELCGKFVTYEIATSAVWIVIAVVGLFIAYKSTKKIFDEDDMDLIFFGWFVRIVLSIILPIIILFQTFDIVTCVTFPEKIVIERAVSYYNMHK